MKTPLRLLLGISLCLIGALALDAAEGKKVRLFILSGQSNMVGLNPNVSFTPALRKEFPDDELIVVRSAQGGQPIRRWLKEWKAPEGFNVKDKLKPGDLYTVLMEKVSDAAGKKKLDSVAFVWMQGEADAQRGPAAIYEEGLRTLIKQVRDDLKRPDTVIVIGRLSDFGKGRPGWESVRKVQEKVAGDDPLGRWVDTDDLNGKADGLHYTKEGYEELGRRFAAKVVELLKAKR